MKKFLFAASFLLFSQTHALANPRCSSQNLVDAPIGYTCVGNTGATLHKRGADIWARTQDGKTQIWTANQDEMLNWERSISYCAAKGERLPDVSQFALLSRDLRQNENQIAQLFHKHPKDHLPREHAFWTSSAFSSVMSYLWDPKTGTTHSRYFTDHGFRVVCVN